MEGWTGGLLTKASLKQKHVTLSEITKKSNTVRLWLTGETPAYQV
jgi:hypothetical protein